MQKEAENKMEQTVRDSDFFFCKSLIPLSTKPRKKQFVKKDHKMLKEVFHPNFVRREMINDTASDFFTGADDYVRNRLCTVHDGHIGQRIYKPKI